MSETPFLMVPHLPKYMPFNIWEHLNPGQLSSQGEKVWDFFCLKIAVGFEKAGFYITKLTVTHQNSV